MNWFSFLFLLCTVHIYFFRFLLPYFVHYIIIVFYGTMQLKLCSVPHRGSNYTVIFHSVPPWRRLNMLIFLSWRMSEWHQIQIKFKWIFPNWEAPGSSPHRRCRPRTWTWSCTCARPSTPSRCSASTRVLSASLCCSRSSSSSRPTSQPAQRSRSGEFLRVATL